MATDLMFAKGLNGAWYPADMTTMGYCDRQRRGDIISGTFTKPRDVKRHRKFFAMLNVGYEYWEPDGIIDQATGEWRPFEKNPDLFREWVIIQAGYFEERYFPDGSVQLRAKSIKFNHMEEEEFGNLFHAVLNVIIKLPNSQQYTYDEFRDVIDEIADFGDVYHA